MPLSSHRRPPSSSLGDRGLGPLACLSAALLIAVARAGDPLPDAPAPEVIREWIAQLGADQFAQREAAARSLASAGPAVLEPLAEAARSGDLEVASRAVDLIRGYLGPAGDAMDAGGDDPSERATPPATGAGDGGTEGPTATADPTAAAEAERLLEMLAEAAAAPVAQLATTTLEFHQLGMHESARERLESLGAKVGDAFLNGGGRGLEAVIDSRWQGTAEDLRLLARLRNLRQVGIHGVRLDPAALAVLGRLRGMESLRLYGTGVSDEAVEALAKRFPNAEIDIRKGGKLGVGGQRIIGPCQITQVVAGSAADRAGIQIGDVVLTMDGEPIRNFEALTAFVGRRGPGDSIEVEVERPVAGKVPERFTCTVTLDGWD